MQQFWKFINRKFKNYFQMKANQENSLMFQRLRFHTKWLGWLANTFNRIKTSSFYPYFTRGKNCFSWRVFDAFPLFEPEFLGWESIDVTRNEVTFTEQAHRRNIVMAGKAILLPGKIILSWRLQQVVIYDLVLAQDKVTNAKELRKSVSRGRCFCLPAPPSPWT